MGLSSWRSVGLCAAMAAAAGVLSGCGASAAPAPGVVTSVVPSAAGVPNSLTTWGTYEFVSVQGTGQIFSYNLKSGEPVAAGAYNTPCEYPSGMAVAAVGGVNVMAVTCYDTGQLLTLAVHADGSLSALGEVGGLDTPYPGMALDGTNVLVPLFGKNHVRNGGVARVSLAVPAQPVVTGVATLESPVKNGFANPGALTVAGGYVYVAAGSEDGPLASSSTIQVVNEATMQVVGTPLAVAHSPQRIAVMGTTAFVTEFDAESLVAVDVSDPTRLTVKSTLDLPHCSALPVVMKPGAAIVGCYGEGTLLSVDVSSPAEMTITETQKGFGNPQSLGFAAGKMVVASGSTGGAVYVMNASGLSGKV